MPRQTPIRQQLSRISPLAVVIILLFAAVMTYFLIRSFAASGTATLYTNPGGSPSVITGQTFTVDVRISTGAGVPVTGASVYLSYPTNKLQVLGEAYNGSPYTTSLTASDSGGILRMDRAAFPAVSGGDQTFAQVSFKAIAVGSAPISFTSNSIVTSGEDDSNILTQKTGVTYNIAAPATPPPPSTGSGGSSSGSSSSRSSGSTGSAGGSARTVTGGTSTGGSAGASTGGSSSPGSSPAGSSGNPTDNTGSGDSETVGSSNVSTIQITILDSQNKPVEGAEVTVGGQTVKTDKNGVARFSNVAAGKQTLAVKYNGKKTATVVQVKGASTEASPELFKVSIKRDKFNPALLVLPVLILLAAGVFFLRPWGIKFAKAPVTDDSPPVISSSQPPATTPPAGRKLEAPGTVYAPTPDSSPPPNDTDGVKK